MTLRILVSRHSAFYSPLIATIGGGFLKEQGFDATYGTLAPGQTSRELLHAGEAHVIQSAVSSNWAPMERGIAGLPLHFAQINCRDGFFLVGRPGATFSWKQLEGASLVADHAAQPMAMLRYALWTNGVDWGQVVPIDKGTPEQMADSFREGVGDMVHLQSPAAHQLAAEGGGEILVSIGASMPRVAFSSLSALPAFPSSPEGQAFLAAFAKAKEWVRQAPAEEVAMAEGAYFSAVPPRVLTEAIQAYQDLGCWDGGIAIPRDLYEQTLDVFQRSAWITKRHAYEDVVLQVPI